MYQLRLTTLPAVLAFTAMLYIPALTEAQPLRARLTGPKEVPVCSTTGKGTFQATVGEDDTTLNYELTYRLDGTATAAHIHLGKRTDIGGIVAFLCGGGKPACPTSEQTGTATEQTVTGMLVASDVTGPEEQGIEPGEFAEMLQALKNGLTYANVHSDICPGGEIRGQIR